MKTKSSRNVPTRIYKFHLLFGGRVVTCKVDYEDRHILDKYDWIATNRGVISTTGVLLSRLIMGVHSSQNPEYKTLMVFFKDGYYSNLRKSNLIVVTRKRFSQNCYRVPMKYSDSNPVGVIYSKRKVKGRYYDFWVAQCKNKRKAFSVSKYGYEKAKSLAISARREFESDLLVIGHRFDNYPIPTF
jgi:hypothetical protein